MYKKLVSKEEMQKADRLAIEGFGISEEILIENAALSLLSECPSVSSARIFCGKGNNGADGYALARHLFLRGVDVEIISLFEPDHKNFEIAKALGIKITPFDKMEDKETDLLVDCLFGTGLSKEITGSAFDLISYMNEKKGVKIACDIPSGIDASSGAVLGIAFKADKTVTLGFLKKGLFTYPGADFAGEVILKEISIPKETVKDTKRYLVDDVVFKKREKNTHKGSYGHVLCVAGSYGMMGAAYMAGKACLKAGVGLLTMAVPDCILPQIAPKIPEAMTIGLPHNGHTFTQDAFSVIEDVSKYDTLLIGPGIRNTEEVAYLVKEAITLFKGKNIIIDASALACLSHDHKYFEGTIITPHPGEMANLINKSPKEVEADREKVALSFAQKNNCTVILKGAKTITAKSDGNVYYNNSGNPGMAKGGSGDVLSGILAAFAAGKIEGAEYKAPFIHGLSGDMVSQRMPEGTFSATDLIKEIPKAIKKCIK